MPDVTATEALSGTVFYVAVHPDLLAIYQGESSATTSDDKPPWRFLVAEDFEVQTEQPHPLAPPCLGQTSI